MQRDHVGNVPYGGTGIFECTNPGQVALTFDDGPWKYTEDIIDELDKYNFKATFFITGNNLFLGRQIDDKQTEWPALLREMHRRGHQLGSHSWTHQHLDRVNHTERVREMVYNEMALRNVLGLVPTYMRLPYGGPRSRDVVDDLDDLGYHVVQWSVDTKDYLHNSEDKIRESLAIFDEAVSREGDGSYIVLCHDIREWTARALVPAMLEMLADRGYEAVTVGECLDDPSEFWYRDPNEKKDDELVSERERARVFQTV
ncbi:carbohydrate esterase family 4 protein [Hypoxylon rubiginosum]|uniref:Carbohydrate esterase family 4 protein n=1 Tax=Hypoxylon rubiginosum TaxID=110542 RepID=A0ACB9ZA89_9PEZI|nr:carbohydrate esterase family 4 protein [Hypoxylon rubiginosum]